MKAGVDAVVVMVGLNDFKKILRGNTSPAIFRTDIESFLRDLREQVLRPPHSRFSSTQQLLSALLSGFRV
jgi:lysophospholipase L1-like esterase